MLRAEAFEVVGEAENGESGVAAARALQPEVVLVDVQLPDIDGFEVTRQILSLPEAPVVILISSRDRSDYGQRVSQSGASGFISKADLGRKSIELVLVKTG